MDWVIEKMTIRSYCFRYLAFHCTLSHVVDEVRVFPVNQISINDSLIVISLQSFLLGFIPQLKRCLIILYIVKFMFYWANTHQFLNPDSFSHGSSGFEEIILVTRLGHIVMGEVNYRVCTFYSYFNVTCSWCHVLF